MKDGDNMEVNHDMSDQELKALLYRQIHRPAAY